MIHSLILTLRVHNFYINVRKYDSSFIGEIKGEKNLIKNCTGSYCEVCKWAGEVSRQLGMFPALPEDPNSVPSSHNNNYDYASSRVDILFWLL